MAVALATLRELASDGDQEDSAWATALLQQFSGIRGYVNLMKAALAADAMISLERFVRTADTSRDDVIITGPCLS